MSMVHHGSPGLGLGRVHEEGGESREGTRELNSLSAGKAGPPHLMTWLITMGSGGSSRAVRRWGISENFRRGQSKI
jgi:hypothetical protein